MEWKSYYTEAADYSKVAKGASQKKTLGNLVIYNVVAMSIENYMTCLLMKTGFIPEHASISGMFRELKKLYEMPAEFQADVRFMNRFMNFCSLEVAHVIVPTDEEVVRMIGFMTSLEAWIVACLAIESKPGQIQVLN